MSSALMIKMFLVGLMSLAFAYAVFERCDHEIGTELKENQARYIPYVPGYLLPFYFILIIVVGLYAMGVEETINAAISLYVGLFLHISFFYSILIVLLPILRKLISARAIAFLWMLPNYLYMMLYSFMEVERPLIVFHIPNQMLQIGFGIILIGAVIVLLFNIIAHIRYRHRILKGSKEVTDFDVLKIWKSEIERANIEKPKFRLVVSNHITTPLSIGLYKRSTRVVLPHLNYTEEELTMIFRHEIVHIGREDVWSKFFLIFCTALCWYNPLMWIAKRNCSDDLELSCDETVLIDMDESQRKKYALLILNTAASQQGFTTCLSASASALQYRLKNIVKPRKRYTGSLIVGLTFFLLALTCGFVTLAYDNYSGSEAIFNNQDTSNYKISMITLHEDYYSQKVECVDVEGFHQYLSDLELSKITGNYSFEDESETRYTFVYETPNGTMGLVVSDYAIKVVPFKGKNTNSTYYYLEGGMDWKEFHRYIKIYPALKVAIKYESNSYYNYVNTMLLKVEKDGNILYEVEKVEDHETGRYGSTFPEVAMLDFSNKNVVDYQIDVHSWDYKETYTITQNDVNEKGEFTLPNYPAHYYIYATLKDELGELVHVEFLLNLGEIE